MADAKHDTLTPLERAEDGNQKRLDRRQLLKIITATSGAVAASQIVPDRWSSPLIKHSVLPAYASVSPPPRISNLQKAFSGINNCQTGGGAGSSNTLSFDYDDPTGQFTNGSVVIFLSNLSTGIPSEIDIFNFASASVTGDGFQGTVTMEFCTRFGGGNSVTNQVQIRNTQGSSSNSLTVIVSRPVGAEQAGDAGIETAR